MNESTVMTDATDTGRAPRWFCVVLVLASLGFWGYFLRKPLAGEFRLGFQHHNAARYAIMGRNYVRHGFTPNLGAPDLTPGARTDARDRWLYLHHPPLAPLIVGAAFSLAEPREDVAQLPFAILGLLTPLAMFVLARRCVGGAGPAFAAAFMALPPLATLYAGHVDPQGPIVVLGVTLTLFAYLRFRESRRTRDLMLAGGCALLGLLSDWSVAYALGFIFLADRFLPGGTRDGRVAALPALAVAFFLAHLGWVMAMGRSPAAELFAGAGTRSLAGILRDDSGQANAAVASFFANFPRLLTTALLALGALGAIVAAARARAGGGPASGSAAIACFFLFLTGCAHVVLFPQGALVHDYWIYLLLPAFALAAAIAAETIRERVARAQGEGFGVLLSVVMVAGVAWPSAGSTKATLANQERGGLPHAMLGRAVREQVRPHERVASNLPYNTQGTRYYVFPEFTWYSDRRVRGGIHDRAALDRAIAEEGAFDWFCYAPLPSGPDPILADLEARLGNPKRLQFNGGYLLFFDLLAK
jgi:4-amino-4-deoxy-L-arabinose transferase-like glycosyltransferase